MGDRANVLIKDGEEVGVILYTHWGGYGLPVAVQSALARKVRWDDAAYLARIVFDAMKGDDKGETGYGISTRICDNGHPLIVLDCDTGNIYLANEDKSEIEGSRMGFGDFLDKDLREWWDRDFVRADR